MQEQKLLEKIQAVCQNALTDSLTGIYLHGSLAFGCFQWEKSDIDFLVVVRRKPTQKEKESLLSGLLALEGNCPPKGLEMSVVLENVCNPVVSPTPFELHYSKFHRERARKNPADFCRSMNGTDPDLAAHMTVVQKAGIVLCGPGNLPCICSGSQSVLFGQHSQRCRERTGGNPGESGVLRFEPLSGAGLSGRGAGIVQTAGRRVGAETFAGEVRLIDSAVSGCICWKGRSLHPAGIACFVRGGNADADS